MEKKYAELILLIQCCALLAAASGTDVPLPIGSATSNRDASCQVQDPNGEIANGTCNDQHDLYLMQKRSYRKSFRMKATGEPKIGKLGLVWPTGGCYAETTPNKQCTGNGMAVTYAVWAPAWKDVELCKAVCETSKNCNAISFNADAGNKGCTLCISGGMWCEQETTMSNKITTWATNAQWITQVKERRLFYGQTVALNNVGGDDSEYGRQGCWMNNKNSKYKPPPKPRRPSCTKDTTTELTSSPTSFWIIRSAEDLGKMAPIMYGDKVVLEGTIDGKTQYLYLDQPAMTNPHQGFANPGFTDDKSMITGKDDLAVFYVKPRHSFPSRRGAGGDRVETDNELATRKEEVCNYKHGKVIERGWEMMFEKTLNCGKKNYDPANGCKYIFWLHSDGPDNEMKFTIHQDRVAGRLTGWRAFGTSNGNANAKTTTPSPEADTPAPAPGAFGLIWPDGGNYAQPTPDMRCVGRNFQFAFGTGQHKSLENCQFACEKVENCQAVSFKPGMEPDKGCSLCEMGGDCTTQKGGFGRPTRWEKTPGWTTAVKERRLIYGQTVVLYQGKGTFTRQHNGCFLNSKVSEVWIRDGYKGPHRTTCLRGEPGGTAGFTSLPTAFWIFKNADDLEKKGPVRFGDNVVLYATAPGKSGYAYLDMKSMKGPHDGFVQVAFTDDLSMITSDKKPGVFTIKPRTKDDNRPEPMAEDNYKNWKEGQCGNHNWKMGKDIERGYSEFFIEKKMPTNPNPIDPCWYTFVLQATGTEAVFRAGYTHARDGAGIWTAYGYTAGNVFNIKVSEKKLPCQLGCYCSR